MPQPTAPASRRFAPVGRSVREARHFVVETLLAWGLTDLTDRAALLTSEVVGNAVLHARTGLVVEVERLPDGDVCVAVSDGSPAPPVQRGAGLEDSSGRGMALLSRLSMSWGAETHGSGKTVSFRLRPGLGADEEALLWADPQSGDLGSHP